jgi:hypothetical protein
MSEICGLRNNNTFGPRRGRRPFAIPETRVPRLTLGTANDADDPTPSHG